jgi:hypothetical protein
VKVSERVDQAGVVALSEDQWERFVVDASPRVRRVVAGRTDAPEWVLERLAGDRDRQVRQAVVDNPACPSDVLLVCLRDVEWWIRWDAVQHRNADENVRRAAVRSPYKDVRLALAQLRDLAPDLVEALVTDSEWQVREQLATNTPSANVLQILMKDADARVRGEVALNDAATEEQLRTLADDRSAVPRAMVAARQVLPQEVIFRLATDRSENVRWWLCVTHDSDVALMKAMSTDSSELVADHAKSVLGGRDDPDTDVDLQGTANPCVDGPRRCRRRRAENASVSA